MMLRGKVNKGKTWSGEDVKLSEVLRFELASNSVGLAVVDLLGGMERGFWYVGTCFKDSETGEGDGF
jgi:hypothetical protein